jgi:hypothetical protein
VIEGKLEGRIEMTERRGRRRKQLLDDLKEKKRCWKLKEEALTLISGFGRDVDEIFDLLGYYAASCGNCLPTFRDNVSVRVETLDP